MEPGKEYYAFISYKREDEKWAKWFQKKLEYYKLPIEIIRTRPELPQFLRPIFKDTTDLNGDTLYGSINAALLAKMPKGAVLVNTARKEVVNEDELIQFMQERHDFRYVTDVMPAADQKMNELFEGRYFATPKKMGAQTAETNINAGIAAAKQIVAFFEEGCERFRLNK